MSALRENNLSYQPNGAWIFNAILIPLMFLHAVIWKQNTSLLHSKLRSGSCSTTANIIMKGVLLWGFFKQQKVFKILQRQSLTWSAPRGKRVMPNSSHCALPHLRRRHLDVAGMCWTSRQDWQSCGSYRTRCCSTKSTFRCSVLMRSEVLFFFPSLLTMRVKYNSHPCPTKWLTVCPLYLSIKIARFKSYAEHSPVPTDFRRAVLFLLPSCKHRKLRTDWDDHRNSGAKRFLALFFSPITRRTGTNSGPIPFPPSDHSPLSSVTSHLLVSSRLIESCFQKGEEKWQTTSFFGGATLPGV